jgi:hypothetical protein
MSKCSVCDKDALWLSPLSLCDEHWREHALKKYYRLWRDHFADVLDEQKLKYVSTEIVEAKEWRFYLCPTGKDDHYATRPMVTEGLSKHPSDVLTCSLCNLQWLVRPPNIEGMIAKEERSYLDLLKRAPRIVAKVLRHRPMSEETLFYLKDTYGIDKDCV